MEKGKERKIDRRRLVAEKPNYKRGLLSLDISEEPIFFSYRDLAAGSIILLVCAVVAIGLWFKPGSLTYSPAILRHIDPAPVMPPLKRNTVKYLEPKKYEEVADEDAEFIHSEKPSENPSFSQTKLPEPELITQSVMELKTVEQAVETLSTPKDVFNEVPITVGPIGVKE